MLARRSTISLPVPVCCRLGHFDPANTQPFSPAASVIGSAAHVATARRLLGEGIVLLKNEQVSE